MKTYIFKIQIGQIINCLVLLLFIRLNIGVINAQEYFVDTNGYTVESIPSPKSNGIDKYVSNPDGILKENTVSNINHLCKYLEEETGVQLAIAVINNFNPRYEGAYNYAVHLFNHWGIGDVSANNGILIFISTNSYDIQLITGSGIMKILTNDKCSSFINDNIDYFIAGN